MSRAAVYDRIGGPEVLRIVEAPDPVPGPGQVVVRVRAAGLNPYDAKVRSGFIPSQTPFPRRIGADMSGRVETVGADARYWDGTPVGVGDEVLGSAAGAVADRAVARASNLARRPEAVPVEVAGALGVAGLTAMSCLRTVPLSAGDIVLVGGASGAVGLIVCQLAKDAGATVIGTAAPRNHEFVRSLGAEPIAYGDGLAERVAAVAAITAVIDCHGREALDAGVTLRVARDRMVAIAGYAAIDELGVLDVERAAKTSENLDGLVRLIALGRLKVPVAATFPLDDVVAAFAALEGTHSPGKIVVLP
jgi:NADPH:quinone reductase-like Zn-dependent oxidoreductase